MYLRSCISLFILCLALSCQTAQTVSQDVPPDFQSSESFFVYLLSQDQIDRAYEFSSTMEMSEKTIIILSQKFCVTKILHGIQNEKDDYKNTVLNICETFSLDKKVIRGMVIDSSYQYSLSAEYVTAYTQWLKQ